MTTGNRRDPVIEDPRTETLDMFLLIDSILFGAYSALFGFSAFILCRRSPSRTRNTMLALSVVMYAVSATHWALLATLALMKTTPDLILSQYAMIILKYLPVINYVLSNAIILWRARVLLNHKLLLFIIPLISLVCTTLGATIASAAYQIQATRIDIQINISVEEFLIDVEEFSISLHLEWAIWFFVVITNFWATGLIFIWAWENQPLLRLLRIKETCRGSTEKALAFLVESGAIYLCIWTAYVATSLKNMDLGGYGLGFPHMVIAQVAGMYPTTIIIIVAMRLSIADILSRPGAEVDTHIVFAPRPPNLQPQTAGVIQNSLGGGSIQVAVSSHATST